QLHLSRESSMSSMSEEYIKRIKQRPVFAHDRWDSAVQVSVTTFDSLIAAYGVPVFTKIDVEGFEDRVLKGLSQPLQSLSFEYTPERIGTALSCLDHLSSIGAYEFNYLVSETMEFVLPNWIDAPKMKEVLSGLVNSSEGGDVYARRANPPNAKA